MINLDSYNNIVANKANRCFKIGSIDKTTTAIVFEFFLNPEILKKGETIIYQAKRTNQFIIIPDIEIINYEINNNDKYTFIKLKHGKIKTISPTELRIMKIKTLFDE